MIAAVGRAGSKLSVADFEGDQLVNDFVSNQILNAGVVINYLHMLENDQSAKLMAISTKIESDRVKSVKRLDK